MEVQNVPRQIILSLNLRKSTWRLQVPQSMSAIYYSIYFFNIAFQSTNLDLSSLASTQVTLFFQVFQQIGWRRSIVLDDAWIPFVDSQTNKERFSEKSKLLFTKQFKSVIFVAMLH